MEDESKLVRALLRRDWESYNSYLEKLEAQGKGTPVATIGYACYIAARQRFAEQRSPEEIIRFVAEARATLAEGRNLPAREAEAVMYAMLDMEMPDVDEIVDGLDVGIIAEIQGQLLFKLVLDAELTDEQLDSLLLEAEQIVNQSDR
ncbi:hypothetical protein [Micromonospora sp. NBC_01813]|uniref:hypothetical protein n=1 Tax=Micromonospora sp. NBC_01813 TaxID=2975988 RepID=UPI002DDAF146|nr:hypothetical protein [Micromonospora sp. NBC_01813]WSA08653.1 hypothetical protein OG958_31515 [Micromonospora sp. NBC_01813]